MLKKAMNTAIPVTRATTYLTIVAKPTSAAAKTVSQQLELYALTLKAATLKTTINVAFAKLVIIKLVTTSVKSSLVTVN